MQQLVDLLEHPLRQVFFLGIGDRLKMHISAGLLIGLIELSDTLGLIALAVDTRRQFIAMLHDMIKEGQIEPYDLFAASEITDKRHHLVTFQLVHDMPIAVSPTIDRLLDITYDE